MKITSITISVVTAALGMGIIHAGPYSDSSVYSKKQVVDPSCPCFFNGLELGSFVAGVWGPDALGNKYDPDAQGDDALGAGVNMTYYFTERIAVEYSYVWFSTRSDRHLHTVDLIYRMPIGYSCWAPYIIGGGGVNSNGGARGVGRIGGGIEYRLNNCIGIFTDYTYNWIAGGDEGWGNGVNTARAGMRIPF